MELVSFSYRHAAPEADLVIDCRELPNPYAIQALKPLNGKHWKVQRFVLSSIMAEHILGELIDKAGRRDIKKVAFGCIGGKHRSVAMAEVFAERLQKLGENPQVTHLAL